MNFKFSQSDRGTTLIELIVALVLLGILVAAMGRGIAAAVNLYVSAKENTVISQKAAVAILRITREFKELTHIVAVENTPLIIYDKLDGRHAIAAVGPTVKLFNLAAGQESLNASELEAEGHILTDQVDRFELSYHAGNMTGQTNGTSTWSVGASLTELSAISLKLSLSPSPGISPGIAFETVVHPRNINSYGGAIPATGPDPPTRHNYCFITVAQPRGYSKFTFEFCLFLLAAGLIRKLAQDLRHGNSIPKHGKRETGSALIWIVAALALISVVTTALVPMIVSSDLSQAAGSLSDQATALAESGYRLAASKYLNADTEAEKNTVLLNLHHQTYRLADDQGQFALEIFPYFFDMSATNTGNTLAVRIPGGMSQALADHINTLAYIEIGGKTYPCTSAWAPPSTTGTLVLEGTTPSFPAGTLVLMAAKSNSAAQTVTSGGDLYLKERSGLAFPDRNGAVSINNHIFVYLRNDRSNHRLQGITDPNDPNTDQWVVPAGSDVILNKFARVESTGTVGSGSMLTQRKLTFHTPLPGSEPLAQAQEWHDSFSTMEHWRSIWGTHDVASYNDDNVLQVTGATENIKSNPQASIIELDWSNLPLDMASIQSAANDSLTYTAQAKVGFEATTPQPDWGYDPEAPMPKYYGAGLLFRLDADQNCYGLSLMRGNDLQPYPYDGLDSNLLPEDDAHLLVLWQATNNGQTKHWLAYKLLDPFFDNMEHGTTNWLGDYPWGIITKALTPTLPSIDPSDRHVNSLTHTLHNIEFGNYSNNTNIRVQSQPIPIVSPCNVVLKFSHFYEIGPGDQCLVELSTDNGGTWQQLRAFGQGRTSEWQAVSIDLGSFPTSTHIQVRFRLVSDSLWTGDGWYIDDVALVTLPVFLSTLAVQISQAATLMFAGGGPTEIKTGSVISSPNGMGRVVASPLLTNADWEGGGAAGLLRIKMYSGTFSAGETLALAGTAHAATVQSFRAQENLIRAYYASTTSCGSGNDNRFDLNRLANERIVPGSGQTELAWPPTPTELWTAESDHFIQIQWDAVNTSLFGGDGTAALIDATAGPQRDIAIRSWENALLFSSSDSPVTPETRPEIGLHSLGSGARNVFFDDFGLRIVTSRSSTPLPPLVE